MLSWSGTDRAGELIDRGKRLGWVMTAIAVGAAVAAYVVFRKLIDPTTAA